MADSLKDFMISIGFKIDEASQKAAVSSADKTQARITAGAEKAGVERMTAAHYRAEMQAQREREIAEQQIKDQQADNAKREKLGKESAGKTDKVETEAAKKARERRETSFKEFEKFALRLGAVTAGIVTAVEGTALGIVAVVDKAAQSFEKLHYSAQFMGTSVKNITSFSYAISQLGGSVEGANAYLDRFSEHLKFNPQGFEGILKSLGVRTRDAAGNIRDATDLAAEALASLRDKPYSEAKVDAGVLGADDITMQVGRDPRLASIIAQKNADRAKVGFDPDAAANQSAPFEQSMRRLSAIASDVGDKIKSDLFDKIKPLLDQLADWIAAHGKDIAKVASDIADALLKIATTIAEDLAGIDFNKIFGQPGGKDGMLPALEGVAVAALLVSTRLGGILSAINLLSGSSLPGWMMKFGLLNWLMAGPKLRQDGIESFDPATGQPFDATNPMKDLGPAPGEEPPLRKMWRKYAPSWLGGRPSQGGGRPSQGAGRTRFGRRVGTDDDATGSDDPLKKFIARHEGAGYNVAYGHAERGGPYAPPKPLTEMTIAEVLAYQHEMKARAGSPAFPVGRAQWVETTLRNLTRGMNPNTKFTPEMQERLFDRSIAGRMGQGAQGFRNEWDSLKNVSDAEINAAIAGHRNAKAATAVPSDRSVDGPAPRARNAMGAYSDRGLMAISRLENVSTITRGLAKLGESGRFKVAPLGVTPSMYRSYDYSKSSGDMSITHNPTFHIATSGSPDAALSAARLSASRGQEDLLRNIQGKLA